MKSIIKEDQTPFFWEQVRRSSVVNMGSAHCHEYYEVYYLLSGERRYFIGNRILDVRAGDVVLIPRGVLHRTTNIRADHERVLMGIEEAWIVPALRECFQEPCIRIPPAQRPDVEQLLRRIGREYTQGDIYSPQLLRQYVSEFLILLKRLIESGRGIPAAGHSGTLAERAAAYICTNYSEPLTLERVAREFSVSREYFSHQFKKVTGFGFSEYVNQVRIAAALPLLEAGDMSITEVAFHCGFNDSNYFATVFKQIKGMSPKKYQKQA